MISNDPWLDMMILGAGFAVFVLVWQWVADRPWAKPRHLDRPLPPAE